MSGFGQAMALQRSEFLKNYSDSIAKASNSSKKVQEILEELNKANKSLELDKIKVGI
jgi:hypothetical protein